MPEGDQLCPREINSARGRCRENTLQVIILLNVIRRNLQNQKAPYLYHLDDFTEKKYEVFSKDTEVIVRHVRKCPLCHEISYIQHS
jgi:hypothetical protein